MDIFRTSMHFLPVNVAFYDTVNMIHDIATANPCPCTTKFMFLRNNKTHKIRCGKINRIHTYILLYFRNI